MSQKEPTPAQLYADAVWAAGSDVLSTTEAMMALCYANHAHTPPFDRAWVVDSRLMEHCKIRSKGTVSRIRDGLVSKGWLRPLHPIDGSPISAGEAKEWQRRRKTVTYLLTIPQAAPKSMPTAPMNGAATAPIIGPTAPMVGADLTAPMNGAAAPMVERTAPIIEPRCPDSRGLPSYDPLRDSLKEPPPPTPSVITDQGGGGEDPKVIEVIEHVAARWGRSAAALAPLTPAVAAALDVWPQDALARHLADDPPDIEDAYGLLRSRLTRLPPGPGACGRRCCTRWRAECDAAQDVEDRTTREAEKEAQRAAEAQRWASEQERKEAILRRNEEITAELGPVLSDRLALAHYPPKVRPTPTMIRALLTTIYADHGHDLDAIRAEAEAIAVRETA